MRVPKQNQMTYDEIGEKLKMSPNKVLSEIKVAFNKMINYLVDENGDNIFDAVMWLKNELKTTEKDVVDKLDERNMKRLKEAACEKKEFFEM